MITEKPKKQYLKILGFNYEVKVVETNNLDEDIRGDCNTETLTITVRNTKMINSTLLHEIIEAINFHLELNLQHEAISQLETALRSILTENKLLNLDTVNKLLGKK